MTQQFTASEVRDYLFSIEERSSRQWLIAHDAELGMLRQFADLLEAQERAVPVAYAEFADNGCVRMWSRGYEERSPGTRMVPLYTHPAPSDAERLAEALEIIDGWMELYDHQGTGSSRDASRSEKEWAADRAKLVSLLTAHSAQAQPHDLIKTGDPDVAPSICDANGEVVLAYCRKCKQGEGDLAESCPAQPPAARVPDALAVFEVVSGVEGPCLTISRKADGKPRHEYRLAGPKPWGGGNTTHSFKVHTRELREQIDAIEAALAAQENPNG